MIIDDEILVLKEVKYKDNDKILHVISKKHGKMQIMSRGCKKNNSPLVNISQIMAFSRCQLFVSRDMYIINNGELVNNFYNIRSKISAFLYGTYILEVLNYISHENEVDEKIFDMTIKLYEVLDKVEDNEKLVENIISVYELKLISMLGYRPQIKKCITCGSNLFMNKIYYFNVQDGGIQCNKCANIAEKGLNVTSNEIVALNEALSVKLDNIEIIKSIDEKLNILIRRYMFYYIGKSNFTTLKFLKKGDIYG
ncbi:DNA repair protein RecO [Sedimentibacter sp. zth1]|uniref:DNA repair protein RecO n=1 Tax=Sedimentibacter sp. zth1 TaxID=2816908 RepID=UPI001A91BF0E|nr:DNA repair protein RecO [Sedimentibacter sp. zth1]QSX06835.1 DNA repair protein RecO [Sedimentibacter sp. zth1]